MKAPAWIVSPQWLYQNRSAVKVVDARWYLAKHGRDAEKEYEDSHISGAIPVNLSTELGDPSSGLRNTWAPVEQVARVLSEKGLERTDTVVVYDSKGFSACRVAWLLDAYGQESVAVLDGGFDAWLQFGYPTDSGPFEKPASPSQYVPELRQESVIVSKAEMLAALEDSETVIIDARNPERFAGADGGERSGHMPGAVNLHYAQIFEEGTASFKLADDLRRLMQNKGLLEAKRLIATCGSGVTACIPLWALKILGREDAALYDGSWDEWQRDEAAPVEKGAGS